MEKIWKKMEKLWKNDGLWKRYGEKKRWKKGMETQWFMVDITLYNYRIYRSLGL